MRSRWTVVATSLGFAVVQLDVSVVNVAIRPIGLSLGGGVSGLQWVVSAYTVAFAALILSAGAIGDRIGAKRLFIAGFALFTGASVACGLAPSLGILIAARGVQGIGAAVLVPCSLTLLNHSCADDAERVRAVGIWAASGSAALSAGPLIGGALVAALGWRAIFFINVPIGLAGILLTVRGAVDTPRSPGRGVDLWGQLLAIVCLVALAAATIEAGAHGLGNHEVMLGYVVALVAGLSFVAVEAHGKRPMLPLALFCSRTFSCATAIGFTVNVAFYGLIFVLSLFFQRAQQLSPLQTGLAFAPMTAAVMVSNLRARWLLARIGTARLIGFAALLMAVGAITLVATGRGTGYGAIVVQLVCIGTGLGLLVPVMTSALLSSVELSRSGIASGALNSARQTGSVVGVAVYGALIAGGKLVHGLHVALVISAVLALTVLALSQGLRSR
jgi:MFS transporter, DHA2 family, methylenomycin A resistance protein